jgi:tyrosine-protein kinase Etk/Wzc
MTKQSPSAVPATRSPGHSDDQDFNPREFLRVVLKHWRLMLGVLSGVMAAAVLYLILATPIWQATVSVKLPDENKVAGPGQLKELMMLSSAVDPVETYMEEARSFNVAYRAAQDAGLTSTAQFSSAHDLSDAVETLLKGGMVNVTNVKLSNILDFTVQVQDPQLAVRLADAWAQAFIGVNLDFARSGAAGRLAFIEGQLAELKGGLMDGEDALKRLSQRQGTLHDAEGGARDNPIVSLQTKVQDLLIEKSDLASRYSPDFPQVKEVNAEYEGAVAELNRQMKALPSNDLEYSRVAREVNANENIYNDLLQKEQEARISENVDESGIEVLDVARPPHRPVSPQKLRVLGLCFLLGVFLSVVIAGSLERWLDEVGGESEMAALSGLPVLAMVSDWRAEVREGLQGGDLAGKRSPSRNGGRHDPLGLISNPGLKHTYYNEAFKVLRTNLAFSGVDRKLRTFTVLSPGASEGKTLINANLALALAAAGKKVLLVDADLRKPSLHKLFKLDVGKDQGLPLLLSGQGKNLESQLRKGPVPGLWLLPCGVLAPNPSELLGSAALAKVLATLTARFDHVVFDASPVLPVTDGVILATRMDGVALLARFEQTRRVEFKRALEHLAAVKAPMLGTILNAVDLRKYSYAYGYGSRYYSYHGQKA